MASEPRKATKKSPAKRHVTRTKSGSYDDKTKAAVIETLEKHGLAKAASESGISKTTIRRWAAAVGIETSLTGERAESIKKATEASLATRKERRDELASKLLSVAELSIDVQLQRLEFAKKNGGITTDTLQGIVGAGTRAIHDLELLEGRATERGEVVAELDDILALQAAIKERG